MRILKLNVFFILLLMLVLPIRGETTWEFKNGNFLFLVQVDSVRINKENKDLKPYVRKVKIFDVHSHRLVQVISPEQFTFDSYLDSSQIFILEDVNFDGFTDVRILNWLSVNLQRSYWYWIFDSNSGQFKFDSTLVNLWNPTFNEDKRTVHTEWRIGMHEMGYAVYKWKDRLLQLQFEQIETWGIGENPEVVFLETKCRVNEVLVIKETELSEVVTLPTEECGP